MIHYLMNDFGGGRRRLKLAWVIKFQKLTTIPLLAIFIFKYQNFSPATWIYMAMQSSHGLVWIIKDLAFPDSSFQKSATIGAGIASLITVWGEDRWTLCGENHEVCCCTTREADHRRVRHCDHRIYRVMELSAYSCYP